MAACVGPNAMNASEYGTYKTVKAIRALVVEIGVPRPRPTARWTPTLRFMVVPFGPVLDTRTNYFAEM